MSNIRYGKPSMTNLPYELGKAIFEEIDNSKPVDKIKRKKEANDFIKRVLEERKRNGKNS